MEFKDTIAEMLIQKLSDVPEWMERAACSDMELDPLYSPSKETFIREKCGNCPVIKECREHFEDQGVTGVFFGESLR